MARDPAEAKIVEDILAKSKQSPNMGRELKEGEYDLGGPDLPDYEIAQLQPIYDWMNSQQSNFLPVNLDSFTKEIIERFEAAGFWVEVVWYTTIQPDVFSPDVVLYARTKPFVLDVERQSHDVINDTLGVGDITKD